ncbi:hypothetical protein DBIPINDM_005088 [Mesorhizobium sp. AR02]|uniref:hypothetical protein n=1 Tax=Mesorhizobium sp. AR02 TaxID=2865837 RepID=UPI00215F514F|nr:hypothetical protein [Mesorhizobium sp. AR02]UVK51779.1 hypothetical protein DBIPINDM_005088 [Mesorhizobium sp. AR02]
MQITSDLTVTIQKLISARSGFASASQPTFVKAGTALRTEAPVIRPGATGNEDGTEYDLFGGFAQTSKTDVPATSSADAPSTTTADDPYMHAGKANYGELYAEYTRFISSMVEADRQHKDPTVARYFIPAGETQETVKAMDEHDYMWAIQDEMEAAADHSPQAQANKAIGNQGLSYGDATRMASDALFSLQKALPALNDTLARMTPTAVEERLQSVGGDPKLQRLAQQVAKNDMLFAKSSLRYVDRIVRSIESGPNKVDGAILVKNGQGQYQLGDFSISFNGQVMLTSRDTFKAFTA